MEHNRLSEKREPPPLPVIEGRLDYGRIRSISLAGRVSVPHINLVHPNDENINILEMRT